MLTANENPAGGDRLFMKGATLSDSGDYLRPIVHVVDDDVSVRTALQRLFESVGFEVAAYASGQAFLDEHDPMTPGCVILDLRMPELDGMEVQEQLATRGGALPVIVLTAYPEVRTAVRSTKLGAVDVLEKPYDGDELIQHVRDAIAADERRRSQRRQVAEIAERVKALTPRENQVLELVLDGKLNKQSATHLGISERTVEEHRTRLMRKMQARSVAELVRMVMLLRHHQAGGDGEDAGAGI